MLYHPYNQHAILRLLLNAFIEVQFMFRLKWYMQKPENETEIIWTLE